MRYIMMVPKQDFDLLTGYRRQVEMIDAFLRHPLHEQTAVDFNGVPTADYSIAIIAGLNWLDHCASTARADRSNFQPYPAQFQATGDACTAVVDRRGRGRAK